MFYTIGHILFWIVFKIFFGLQCIDLKNVPKKGGVLLASNHVSFIDPPAIGTVIRHRKIYFIARATLFRFPLIRLLLELVHCIPIELKGNWKKGLERTMELLKNEKAVLVFPEGTRSPDGRLKKGRAGVGFLAYNSKVPVVPVLIKGSHEALPKGAKMIKRFKKISVRFGQSINLNDFYKLPAKASTYQKITDIIMENIKLLTS